MTRHWLPALGHVRNGPVCLTVLTLGGLFTWAFPDIVVPVSVDPLLPARGVGILEIASIVLASVLPAAGVPRFGGRELLGGRRSRATHTLYGVVLTLAPLVLIPVWFTRITGLHPTDRPPSPWGLVGLPLDLAAVSTVTCLLAGRVWGVVLTPALFAALVIGQQKYPDSVLTRWFATGAHWHTNSWITAGCLLAAVLVTWSTRSIPLPDRRR